MSARSMAAPARLPKTVPTTSGVPRAPLSDWSSEAAAVFDASGGEAVFPGLNPPPPPPPPDEEAAADEVAEMGVDVNDIDVDVRVDEVEDRVEDREDDVIVLLSDDEDDEKVVEDIIAVTCQMTT